MTGSVSGSSPLFRAAVQVADLPADRTAELVFSSERVILMWTNQPGCSVTGDTMTCTVSGGGTSSVAVNLLALPGASITATLVMTEPDANLDNNTWRADLA